MKNFPFQIKGSLSPLEKRIVFLEMKEASLVKSNDFTEVVKVFRRSVENIEIQQLKNQHARQENQPIILQFPDPFTDGKTIKLYLKQAEEDGNSKSKKANGGVVFVFLLELSALGHLRVNAKINGESVGLRIDVENQNIANYVNKRLNEICVRLGELGFEVNASCCILGKVDDVLDNHLGQLLIDEYQHLVDLTT